MIIFLYLFTYAYATTDQWLCGDSFYDLPTVYIEDQKFEDVCLPLRTHPSKNSEEASCGVDFNRLCVAVRYLTDIKSPLYSALHLQNLPEIISDKGAVARGKTSWKSQALTISK